MEAEGDGGRCVGCDYGGRHVPALAADSETGCVVSQCWDDGSAWTVLRHGYFSAYSVLCHDLCCPTGSMVIP